MSPSSQEAAATEGSLLKSADGEMFVNVMPDVDELYNGTHIKRYNVMIVNGLF